MREILYNESHVKIDNGLYFGRGVFETILVKNKAVFLKEHIERLNNAIEVLNLGEKILLSDVEEFINSKLIINKALKITVTEKNLIYSLRDIKYKDEHYINGFNVTFSKILRNSTSRIVSFKTLNYLENIIEYELCQENGFNESIFLNEKGFVTEGCTSNIFIIKDNEIFTPKKENGLLAGIVRQWVINNFNVEEVNLTKEEVLNSDEIFLTNSLVGVIKVSSLEGRNFNFNKIEEIKEQYDKAISGGEEYE